MKIRSTLLLLLAYFFPAFAQAGEQQYRTVHVTGDYRVKATPDIAYVEFAVTSDAKQVEEAKQKADETLRGVKDVTTKLHIEQKDLKTGYVSIQPKYSYPQNRPPSLDGYNVSYTLTLTVRDLTMLGNVMQHLVKVGVNQVNNVRYDIDKSDQFKLDALKKAVINGNAKAKVLAESAGSTLGAVMRIEESGVNYSPPVMAFANARMVASDASMEKFSGEIPPAGELDVSANVTLVYELKN